MLREQALGEVQALGDVAHLLAHLLDLVEQLGTQQRELVGRALALGAVRDPLGECAHERSEHTVRPPQHAQAKNGDEQVFAVHYPGPIRWPSRCLASSRSAKSTRSLRSLTSVRNCCSSFSSSARDSSSSLRTPSGNAAPCPRIRSANALPTGEIARRNSVPPPKMNVMARMDSQSMASARLS